MSDWQQDVGGDPRSRIWQRARQFQTIYAKYGVTDNFIKVAVWKPHDWASATENAAVAKHFHNAAALARYAGFKGLALDFEPYVAIWGGEAGGSELAPIVYREGNAIANAMHKGYPNMTLVLIKEALYWAREKKGYHGGYGLAVPFLRGLLSSGFTHVVVATELTYKDSNVVGAAGEVRHLYQQFIDEDRLPVTDLSIAPGLWPLGRSYTEKSDRVTPKQFKEHLRAAFSTSPRYVWIYGFGSAWQNDGPYGIGRAVDNLDQYTAVLHDVRLACEATGNGNRGVAGLL